MTQNLIVFTIVAAAALWALWRWLPAAWRRGAARQLATQAQGAGLIDARQADKLSATLTRPVGCGCAQCEGCGADKPARADE